MTVPSDNLQRAIANLHAKAKSSSAYERGPMQVVGKSAYRLDGVDKATGRTKYGQDLFDKKFLFAKVLRAAYPHAEVGDIDTREAKNVPECWQCSRTKTSPVRTCTA